MVDTETWQDRLQRHREQKDAFLVENPRSPLPSGARDSFDGLRYFPPDSSLRFEVHLDEHEHRETLTVETTADGEQTYQRWGTFTVDVDGETVTLQAYRADPDEQRLWVPFRDATSGETTYGAGRYLDLEAPDDRVDGAWVLDFNYAYNPFCAYNDAYECPLVPTENWLEVPVEAGEKRPALDGHDH